MTKQKKENTESQIIGLRTRLSGYQGLLREKSQTLQQLEIRRQQLDVGRVNLSNEILVLQGRIQELEQTIKDLTPKGKKG